MATAPEPSLAAQAEAALRGASTVRGALLSLHHLLARAGIPEPRLEADLLVAHALGTDRTHRLAPLVARRLTREPLAYLLGWREFFGLPLVVRPGVLIPRPETETLVEEALRLARERYGGAPLVADVGCGAGAIAVALAVHLPRARVYALDVSPVALEVTGENCRRHGVQQRVTLLQGDLLEPLPEPVDLVAANLPYVPSGDFPTLQPEVQHEPREALDGGPDGLRAIGRLLLQLPGRVRPGASLLVECDPRQAPRLVRRARRLFPAAAVRVLQDLAHLDRVLVVEGL